MMLALVKAHLGRAQTLRAVVVAWQLAVRQEQTVCPRPCRSDTCSDNTFLEKAAQALLPTTRHDHGTG